MIAKQTLEIRWFIPYSLPKTIYNWFQTDCPGEILANPETRTDYYLLTYNNHLMSLKLRQEQLELKWQQDNLKTIYLKNKDNQANRWQADVERWMKWRNENPLASSLQKEITEPHAKSPWLAVLKKRWQRLHKNVEIEITQITVNHHLFWSLAFEMEDLSECSLKTFSQVIQEVYQTNSQLTLNREQAYAYPSLLQQL